jgi:hypothetical protein
LLLLELALRNAVLVEERILRVEVFLELFVQKVLQGLVVKRK